MKAGSVAAGSYRNGDMGLANGIRSGITHRMGFLRMWWRVAHLSTLAGGVSWARRRKPGRRLPGIAGSLHKRAEIMREKASCAAASRKSASGGGRFAEGAKAVGLYLLSSMGIVAVLVGGDETAYSTLLVLSDGPAAELVGMLAYATAGLHLFNIH